MTTEPSIRKKENIAPITKMGIEGTVAVASLAAAMATILIATNVIAGPAFLASVANPVGIAALFVAAVYFAVAAYFSYQQMHKNEEISGAKKEAQTVVDEKTKGFVTQSYLSTELSKKLDSSALANSVVGNPAIMKAFEDKFQAKTQS
ncbi:MAG: hypothetical protein LBU56_04080 [Rickettsiales bacterium]|jgi:hypothetical protein|nr:hypothetical protein [Rickettsiales bacterium]